MTPTARTLALLRRSGYLAAVVEKWLPKINRRRDLFGFADVLAVHPVRREIVLVQTTSASNLASRIAKVKAAAELPGSLAAGVKVHVHGWAGNRLKLWKCGPRTWPPLLSFSAPPWP